MDISVITGLEALYDRPGPARDSNPEGKRLTYAELEEREPRLAALRLAIDAVGTTGDVRAGGEFCANHWWYGRAGFKAALTGIIGHFADQDDAALTTAAAWDVAYQTLYHRLPDCRHEGPCWRGRR